ncbi:phosphatidylglycerol lysyltransferase domain-containing protein [Bacillus kexueae]|uniref:phosphatidylglycerol lysyltransferase domain-containing protein n=1 Tax=Aeribacillus kexueae TaxID=2078952 RepID=UPI001FAEBB8C|nr:phosphatidylglycerol lysyltransferase domain-containing protein [Bacillus kexueae]
MTISIILCSAIAAIFIGLFVVRQSLVIREPFSNQQWDDEEMKAFLTKHSNHLSHLLFLRDKEIFWSENKKVLILYRKNGRRVTVLGDPIGDYHYLQSGIHEFLMFCQEKQYKPSFYQISEKTKPLFETEGFRFFKLGEEARVPVKQFEMRGKNWAKLRTRLNKFNRKGFQFDVLYPPYSTQLMHEIQSISQSWLGDRNEKSFSVSSFDKNYVSKFPIAILKDPEGEMIAFASLAKEADVNKTIHIDLMRYVQDSPHGTMDVLFVSIMKWASENGFLYCSLGVAPLANVGQSPDDRFSEKIAHHIYQHSKKNYNFKGLKEYKAKFYPEWEPKYFAYRKSFLAITLYHIVQMIQQPPKQQPQSLKKRIGVWLQRAS